MAFVASKTRVVVPAGGGTVTVPVPQIQDVSGNGPSYNLFGFYVLSSLGATGQSANASITGAQSLPTAIPQGTKSLSVLQNATSDIMVAFGTL